MSRILRKLIISVVSVACDETERQNIKDCRSFELQWQWIRFVCTEATSVSRAFYWFLEQTFLFNGLFFSLSFVIVSYSLFRRSSDATLESSEATRREAKVSASAAELTQTAHKSE